MPGLRPLSFFIAFALGLFHDPFWGATGSKAMPLRGNRFCCFEYSLEPFGEGLFHDPFLGGFRFKSHATSWQWLLLF